MIKIVYGPQWFYGVDSIIEVFSFITAILIAYYSYKFYKFSYDRKYKYFGLSFFALAIGALAKVMMNITVYYPSLVKQQIGAMNIDITYVNKAVFYTLGFDIHRILMLFGLLGLYIILSKSRLKSQMILFSYFILLVALFSNDTYHIFYITMAMFLAYIVFFYYKNYTLNKNNKKILTITYAFGLLLISQLCFLAIFLTPHLYAIGGFFQLAGYLILLYSYMSLALPRKK